MILGLLWIRSLVNLLPVVANQTINTRNTLTNGVDGGTWVVDISKSQRERAAAAAAAVRVGSQWCLRPCRPTYSIIQLLALGLGAPRCR